MKAEEVNVDLNELEDFKKRNFEERLWFIDFWANYIKEHSDEEWSKQQNVLINSQILNIREFYKNLEKTEEGRKILVSLKKVRIEKDKIKSPNIVQNLHF